MLKPCALLLFALTTTSACDGGKDDCSNALELIDVDFAARIAEAKSDGEKRALTNVLGATDKYFVAQCRELDAAGQACAGRMKEFLAFGKELEAKSEACFTPDNEEKPGCLEALDMENNNPMGDCKAPMDTLQAAISAKGQADWDAKQKQQ